MDGGRLRLERYEWTLGEPLDRGGFGRVFAASSPDAEGAAVAKLVPMAPGAQRELLFVNLEGARNVVPVLDIGETEADYVLVMPRAEKSLRAHLNAAGKLTEPDAVVVLRDIAAALEDLADRVVHRDLKPENVLYLNGFWCLADFGISRYAEATTAEDTRKYSMTPPYAAPEQWRFEQATAATDVYALGVIAFEMLAGTRPFAGPDFREQHLHALPPGLTDVSGPLAALVAQCLHKDRGSRPPAADISRRLATMASQAVRPGLGRLQQAHHDAVVQQAEMQRQVSEAESWFERRAQLYQDARHSLAAIGEELETALTEAAPAIVRDTGPSELWILSLGDARLTLAVAHEVQGAQAANGLPFDVAAYSELSLIAHGTHGYRGRAHSLWYCDLKEEGLFSWYELAFMNSPFTGQGTAVVPFSQFPVQGAIAFIGAVGAMQLAWTPTRLVPGELDDFIARWGDWLAAAYVGDLARPTQLPEHHIARDWRRR